MNTTYSLTQTRFSLFGSEVLKILPMLKEGGIPASLVDQFMRSAASVGANYAEARGAESTADFLHKLQIALKECREAKHWLIILPLGCNLMMAILKAILSLINLFFVIQLKIMN